MTKVRYVGLDVHKESIVIAVADEGREEARDVGEFPADWHSLQKQLRRLERGGYELRLCYEAGPTGFELHRRLVEAGYENQVVAPSLVPVKAGERIKTDRRDARKLARCLRQGRRFTDGSNWTQRHLAWIRRQTFEHEAHRRVLRDDLKAVEDAMERVARLTADIQELVEQSAQAPLIVALQALRGIQVLSATVIAAEFGDLRRFDSAGQMMAFVGLVPSEHSTGSRTRRGSITRTGNRRVRRILIEAAWHYLRPPQMSRAIRERNAKVSEQVRQIAWKAQKRLHRKFRHLAYDKGKPSQVAVTAVARELVGFVWAIGQQEQLLAE